MSHPQEVRLQELCDDNDLDGLLALVTIDEIAEAWWRNQRARAWENDDEDDTGPDAWTFDFFWIDAAYAPERAAMHQELVLKILELAEPDEVGAVSAGPLENLVADK